MSNILSLLNLVLTVATIGGGIFAFRYGMAATSSEVQERVITAMSLELESLTRRLDSLERENVRLNLIITTICNALKRKRILINIDADLVTISDQESGVTQTERIHEEA